MINRFLILPLICFVFTACTGQPEVTAQVLRYAIIPESPRPGDPVTIGVNTNEIEAHLIVDGQRVSRARFFNVPAEGENPSFRAAFLGVPATVRANSAVIRLLNEWDAAYNIEITISPREFQHQTLHFDAAVSSLVNDPNPQRTREAEIIWSIWSATGNHIYHTGPFSLPTTTTRRTSPFGFRRTNIYSDGTRGGSTHTGVDFGMPTGTEIYACARGMVKLSRMRILTGNSVIIEHAPGVYTMYYHLDSVIAQENTIVETGALIGLSGATGMVTGPHLHWEMRVGGEYADPDVFVSRPLLDKNLIINRIFN
ncbi:MAG: M23 family metallopeptidase [Treponema sp.]|nr:M23 family metallopeptidase [Treponema sp.]MCL2237704.1 M23 family metallopeptidase [Treponema sp.]